MLALGVFKRSQHVGQCCFYVNTEGSLGLIFTQNSLRNGDVVTFGAAGWIQTMKDTKRHRYCYCSLPSWKYFQSQNKNINGELKTLSTLHRFQMKTILFCSGYGYRPHYNSENDHRKRIVLKTLSRVERFENGTVWKRCFPSVDGENDDVTTTTQLGCRSLNREYPR